MKTNAIIVGGVTAFFALIFNQNIILLGAGIIFIIYGLLSDSKAAPLVKEKSAEISSNPIATSAPEIQSSDKTHVLKFCYSCGKELIAGSKFCESCGATVINPEIQKEPPKQKIDQSKPIKNHTTFAKIWIGFMLIANIFTLFLYVTTGNQIARTARISSSSISIFILIGIGMIILLIFLYYWKKWAFYGLCGLGIITLLLNLSMGMGGGSILGLIGIGILYLSISSEWNLYE